MTGVSSYVGSFVAESLSTSCEVIGTFRRENQRTRHIASLGRVKLLRADLACATDLHQLPGDVDAVVHNAATFPWTDVSQSEVAACNVVGSAHLVQWTSDHSSVARFIHYSTVSVYGNVAESVLDEDRSPVPTEIYGSSKLAAEHLVRDELAHLNPTQIRFPVVLGAGAHRAFLPRVADALLRDEDVTIRNPDARYNAMTTLRAVADFTERLLAQPAKRGRIVNLGADDPMSVRGIIELLKTRTASRSRIVVDPEPTSCYRVDFAGAIGLGYRAPSVKDALEYYCAESGWRGR